MSVQFISHDLEWTEPMISLARQRIANPLSKYIEGSDVEISILLKRAGGEGLRYSMSVLLKSANKSDIEMIGRDGDDFVDLTNVISSGMRLVLKNNHLKSKFFI